MKLTCRDATRLISDGLDKDLTLRERIALRLHLTLCDACTRVKSQLEFMRRAISVYSNRDDRDRR